MRQLEFEVWKNQADYPPLLKEIPDAPDKLYCEGDEFNTKDKYFSIVGTRHASNYGLKMAEIFTDAISKNGFTVVSGLAYGIDAMAHKTALSTKGKTIAVLGSGLKKICPPTNIPLAKKIKENGALITEYPPNYPASKWTFPARNRIIAGISIATLVIEAPERSGALITARLALEYNRDVFAVPGNVNNGNSMGANRLIQKGWAYPVINPSDIFNYLGMPGEDEGGSGQTNNPHLLKKNEETIYSLLEKDEMSFDEISTKSRLPVSEVISCLSFLEIKGLVTVIGAHAFKTR